MTEDAVPARIVIRHPIEIADLLWAAFGLLVLVATGFATAAAGWEDAVARDPITGDYTVETYAWAAPLMTGLALAGYPMLRTVFFVFNREKAVQVDANGIVLHGKAAVRARWGEIDRIVFWRKRVTRFGFVKRWEPQIGIVSRSERTANFQRAAGDRSWTAEDLRPNGVPEWLPGGIQKHSVRLSFRSAAEVVVVVARFAPDVPVSDEREPGRSTPVAER
jgi:hypothetical protein